MVFEKIQNDCVFEFMEDDSTDEYESFKLNPLYNPDLIDYFQKYYLPYIFIWELMLLEIWIPITALQK